MTSQQTTLVRDSFALVAPMAEQAAALFYDKLFERDPALQALFRGDMAQQSRRLMEMIGAAVGLLDRPETLDPTLRALGARHAGYGVQPAHYAVVGGALLDTLAAGLGERFTPDTRAAWAATYAHISRVMQQGSAAGAG